MDNEQEITDAVNGMKAMRQVQNDYNSKKTKNNTIMLNTIPKLVCFAMVAIVFIQVIGLIVLMIISNKDKNLINLFSQIVEGDLVTIGVSVIGIAVSVWVGLNIYLSLSKEESEKLIQEMELEITSIEECLNNVKSTIKYQKGVMWQEFINLLDSQRNENMLSAYFAYQFGRLFKDNLDHMDISLIHELMQYENEYISMTRMYENGEKKSCYDQSEKLIEKYENFKEKNKGSKGSDCWRKTFLFYINVHIADAKFYRNAVCLRLGGFRIKFRIEQMDEVCVEYKKVFKDISGTAPEYKDINSAKAYIKNTMGYTLDLINQYEGITDENEERRQNANEYMQEAVNLGSVK